MKKNKNKIERQKIKGNKIFLLKVWNDKMKWVDTK